MEGWLLCKPATTYDIMHGKRRGLCAKLRPLAHLSFFSEERVSSTQWKNGQPFLSLCKAQAKNFRGSLSA